MFGGGIGESVKKAGFEPGDRAPVSGIYVERGPRGGIRKEITLAKEHRFPPTEHPGGSFDLRRATHNKSGRSS